MLRFSAFVPLLVCWTLRHPTPALVEPSLPRAFPISLNLNWITFLAFIQHKLQIFLRCSKRSAACWPFCLPTPPLNPIKMNKCAPMRNNKHCSFRGGKGFTFSVRASLIHWWHPGRYNPLISPVPHRYCSQNFFLSYPAPLSFYFSAPGLFLLRVLTLLPPSMRPWPRRVKAVTFFPLPKCVHTRQTPEGTLKPAPMVAVREITSACLPHHQNLRFNPSLVRLTHVFVCNQKEALSSATTVCYYLLKKAHCEGLSSAAFVSFFSDRMHIIAASFSAKFADRSFFWAALFFFQLYNFTFMRPVTHWPPLTFPHWQINYIEACTGTVS